MRTSAKAAGPARGGRIGGGLFRKLVPQHQLTLLLPEGPEGGAATAAAAVTAAVRATAAMAGSTSADGGSHAREWRERRLCGG